ncbi:MAG: hypothetical protein ACR2NJ_08100 [Acidimicrobiales bacterium]
MEEATSASAPGIDVLLAGRTASLQAALASIALRIDTLTTTTTTFRTLMSDRLTDYGEQVNRAQSTTSRDVDEYRRLQERALADIEAALSETEASVHRLDRTTASVATKVEAVTADLESQLDRLGERMHHELSGIADEIRGSVNASSRDLKEGLDSLEESTAGALIEVATRLERLAGRSDGATTDPELRRLLDSVAPLAAAVASFPDTLSPVSEAVSKVAFSVARVEELTSAIAESSSEEGHTEAMQELRRSLDAISADVAELGASGQEHLDRALDQLVDRLGATPSPWTSEGTATALARLENTIANLASAQLPERDRDPPATTALSSLEETIERLSSAQAEDLERILDAIEDLNQGLNARLGAAPAGPSTSEEVMDQLRRLTEQVEAVRRRIALRARPAPAIDEAGIVALADALADRLRGGGASSTARRQEPAARNEESTPRRRYRRT